MSQMLQNLTGINAFFMGLGAPIRHQSYIFGRPPENQVPPNQAQQSGQNLEIRGQDSPKTPVTFFDQVSNNEVIGQDRLCYSPITGAAGKNEVLRHSDKKQRENSPAANKQAKGRHSNNGRNRRRGNNDRFGNPNATDNDQDQNDNSNSCNRRSRSRSHSRSRPPVQKQGSQSQQQYSQNAQTMLQ